jgi:LysR family tcuABC transcriptional regulator
MTLNQLKYFLGVVEHGGFAKAAGRLSVAQSALSTQIRKLEEELGAPVLIRKL